MYNISDYILEKLYIGKGFKVDADKHKPISENEFINYLSKEGSSVVYADVNNTVNIRQVKNNRTSKYPFINCKFNGAWFDQKHLNPNNESMILVRINGTTSANTMVDNIDKYEDSENLFIYSKNNADIIIDLIVNESYK